MSYIGPITNSVIDNIIKEINKKDTKHKIAKHIISPLGDTIYNMYYAYICFIIGVFVLIIILLSINIILIANL
jgi:hypothetical protein